MPHPFRRLVRVSCARASFVLAALCLAAGAAHAQDISVGLGAGVDRGRVDCVPLFECDHNASFGKAFVGYRLRDAVDLQAVYFDAGHFKGGDVTPVFGTQFGGTFKVSGFGVTAGYRWDVAPAWSVAARAGAASVRTRFDYVNAGYGSVSKNTLEPLIGVGVAYALTPSVRIGLDYDLSRFKVYTTHGVLQMLGAAVQFSF